MRRSLAALLFVGCASAPVHRTISNGSEDLDATRPAVVFLSSDCTGVLIAPRVVLTAAHCVVAQDELVTVHVRRGSTRWKGNVSSCIVHPQAVDAPLDGFTRCEDVATAETRSDHDLALLRLTEEVPLEMAEPMPVLIAPPIERPDWWRGRSVRLVGWFRRPAVVGEARCYSGFNRIVSVDGAVLTAHPARGGFTTRMGASGGPALIRLDGREHVVGILFGGERRDASASVYAATFHPDNASWLVRVAPEAFAEDLDPAGFHSEATRE